MVRNYPVGDRATAKQFYDQAVQAASDKSNATNLTTAYQLFVSSGYADSTFWLAQYQIANNNFDLKAVYSAVASWRRALEYADTDEARGVVCTNLAQGLHAIGKASEALGYAQEATRLVPRNPTAWVNLSICYGTLRDTKKSLHAAETAHKLAPDDHGVQRAYSFALLFDGQLQRGFEQFETRYGFALHAFTQYPYPRWKGERDATLYLVADQGLGDTLAFARFIPEVARRCRFVHVACHGELTRAFQYAFTTLDNIDVIPMDQHFRAGDYWSTFVSLPWALGLTDDQIRNTPQIDLPVIGVNKSWIVPDRRLHVGIAWAGSALNPINDVRSIPVEHFFDLYRVPGIQLYGLQIGERSKDLYDKFGSGSIRDLSFYVRDVVDTIGFLQHLDLVVCCESALTHICAAADKECWVPYSYLGRDYRVGQNGEHRLWQPKARIFCQGEGETWEPAFGRVIEALRERVDGLG
jgi:predicted negative regulator of RcsB-dependent stress response